MTVAAGRCPYCGEAAGPGAIPPRCPFLGEAACPLTGPSAPDPMGATIALPDDRPEADPEDGFPEADDLIDRTLGQYRIGPVIGRGSMGRVYRGEHAGLGRTCALKVMNPGLLARQPQILPRFWAEARALAGLVHPHVVAVYNLGSDRGYHYIEMEYVPGGVTLKETLVREGPLDPLRATDLTRQVVLALGAAHRASLVHRDVKPSNVLLTAEGQAKLADFGLVRRLNVEELAGAPIVGTPTFMAPELFAGAPADARSDLYAVGVMLYYLLTGRLPYASGRLVHLIQLHQKAPIPDVRQVAPETPDAVATILGRLLAKRPADRHGSADELAADLQSALFLLRSTEALVREALHGLDCVVLGARDQFQVWFPVPNDRLQEVRIEVTEGRMHRRLLTVYSVCCPAEPKHFEFALRLNAELSYGGLSLREVDGRPMFVMTRSYPGGDVAPEEVRAAVQEIARRGDWVEQQLTQADIY